MKQHMLSGTEQLSICCRHRGKTQIREEFLGFNPLEDMDASTIADSITDRAQKVGLDLDKMHGQGYDGRITVAGKVFRLASEDNI